MTISSGSPTFWKVAWIVNLLEDDPGQVIHALTEMLADTPVEQRLDLMRAIDNEVARRQGIKP